MTDILSLPLHLWQTICQILIHSYGKPKILRESLPPFRDVMRLRATCSAIRVLLDESFLSFPLSAWYPHTTIPVYSENKQWSRVLDSMLNTVGNTRWTFDWLLLHFSLVTEGGQLHHQCAVNWNISYLSVSGTSMTEAILK
ncbi:uncharacterized protein LOC142354623 [Convolutriloba macropyga]|uniref:uncharacterized protein LOC142354623 n=1 Tax=Convolutriloba macropyga TaxID=536237 RepID=UPI003F51D777